MRRLVPILTLVLLVAAVMEVLMPGRRHADASARAEALLLAHERDSLLAVTASLHLDRARLAHERHDHEAMVALLRDSVQGFERDRVDAQLGIRQIRTTGALLEQLRTTFPVLDDSAVGLTTVPLEPADTIGIEYLMVPAWFAETFIIDHVNAESWRAQRHGLMAVDSLRAAVTQLQDSLITLAKAEARGFRAGYESAYASYGALNARYIAELRRPRLQVGSALGFILGAGTGIAVAGLIR